MSFDDALTGDSAFNFDSIFVVPVTESFGSNLSFKLDSPVVSISIMSSLLGCDFPPHATEYDANRIKIPKITKYRGFVKRRIWNTFLFMITRRILPVIFLIVILNGVTVSKQNRVITLIFGETAIANSTGYSIVNYLSDRIYFMKTHILGCFKLIISCSKV